MIQPATLSGPPPAPAAPRGGTSAPGATIPLLADLATLYRHRDLLWIWTSREIKIRYKQSALGVLWALLQPLALMAMFTTVFSFIVRIPSDGIPYPVFAYVALLGWTFFATSVTFAIPALVNNLNLVTKIYFPREILPLASIAAAAVDFAISSVALVAMLAVYGIAPTVSMAWLPLIVLVQVLLTIGVVMPAAAAMVFFRDIRFVIPLGVQLWLYATPVIYPVSLVPVWLRPFYVLNPMVGIIDGYRRVLLGGIAPDWESFGISAALSVMLALGGYVLFKRLEGSFADAI